MASVEPHGDDETGDEICEACAFVNMRHQMLQLAIDAYRSSPGQSPGPDVIAIAKAFEAYILDEDNEQPKSSGTH